MKENALPDRRRPTTMSVKLANIFSFLQSRTPTIIASPPKRNKWRKGRLKIFPHRVYCNNQGGRNKATQIITILN
jgi:hypothetical protein